MDKRIYICAAIILIFAILGILAYTHLEIYPRKKTVYPSREVFSNNYYAMEKWLKGEGHSVRYNNQFNFNKLPDISEKVIVANSRACSWENAEEIIPWIEQGGFLIICLDNYVLDDYLEEFLFDFGIIIEKASWSEDDLENNITFPVFDRYLSLIVDEDYDIYTMKDSSGLIRLAELPVGNGILTITGRPYFMYNNRLRDEQNANLSWKLTGSRAEGKNGVLIVRAKNDYTPNKSMFGAIMERGNLVPIIISTIILLFAGFWMVIPVFGLVFIDKQKTARPIKDRFSAEIRFLKKHRALNYYLDVYEREHKITENKEKEEKYKYRELINQYRRIFNGTTKI